MMFPHETQHPPIPHQHVPKDVQLAFAMCLFQDIIIRQPRRFQKVLENILGLDQDKDLVPVSHQVVGYVFIEMEMSWMAHLDEDIHGIFTKAVPLISSSWFAS